MKILYSTFLLACLLSNVCVANISCSDVQPTSDGLRLSTNCIEKAGDVDGSITKNIAQDLSMNSYVAEISHANQMIEKSVPLEYKKRLLDYANKTGAEAQLAANTSQRNIVFHALPSCLNSDMVNVELYKNNQPLSPSKFNLNNNIPLAHLRLTPGITDYVKFSHSSTGGEQHLKIAWDTFKHDFDIFDNTFTTANIHIKKILNTEVVRLDCNPQEIS